MIITPARTTGPFEDRENADGRRRRAARNRDAVVAAVLEIIREQGGGPVPGAAEVAERAGVSERTVFRHFADLDSMFIAAARRQRPLLATYLGPRPDMAELDKRIAAVVRLRSKLYEEVAPTRRVALRLAEEHEWVRNAMSESERASRNQLAAVFEPELKRAASNRSLLLDELTVVSSFSTWETLRTVMGVSAERSRRVVAALMSSILSR